LKNKSVLLCAEGDTGAGTVSLPWALGTALPRSLPLAFSKKLAQRSLNSFQRNGESKRLVGLV